jgi:hypothetical protein
MEQPVSVNLDYSSDRTGRYIARQTGSLPPPVLYRRRLQLCLLHLLRYQ